MIVGLGIDVVEVGRLRRMHARYGERLAARILAPSEWPGYAAAADPARLLAKRFAVKEALGKALGTGVGGAVSLRDVATAHGAGGAPGLELAGGARRRASELGVQWHHVSVSDERELVAAVVVLER